MQSHPVVDMCAATGAGCFATAIGHPADTLKVMLQTRPELRAHGSSVRGAAHLVRLHGPKLFVRGMVPPLANAVLMNTIMFGVFNAMERHLQLRMTAPPVRDDGSNGGTGRRRLGLAQHLIAGGVSGVAQACLSTPVDLLKVQVQVGAAPTVSQLLRNVIRTRPWLLGTGHVMNMWREGLFTAVYLGLYACWRPGAGGEAAPPLLAVAAASGMTGAMAWVVSFPFDSVKSVQQAAPLTGAHRPLTARAAALQLWATGGVAAFFRGLHVSTGRAVLVTSSRLVVFEGVRYLLLPSVL